VSSTAIGSYNDYLGDFAIFTDGTIYRKETTKKETRIYVYRINDDGDFYELKWDNVAENISVSHLYSSKIGATTIDYRDETHIYNFYFAWILTLMPKK